MKRDVQFVKTIDVPYELVRDRLRDAPGSLFGSDAGAAGITVRLAARVRGTEIARDVRMEIVAFDEPAGADTGAHLMLRGDASDRPDLYPHLEARLDALPAAGDRTALFLIATYKPPLGVFGGAADAIALHRLAEQSLARLLENVAEALESE